MKMAKENFTPAPWTTWKNLSSRHRPYTIYSGTKIIALVTQCTFECESESNADLIAASPELYDAMQAIVGETRDGMQVVNVTKEVIAKAINALKKARVGKCSGVSILKN